MISGFSQIAPHSAGFSARRHLASWDCEEASGIVMRQTQGCAEDRGEKLSSNAVLPHILREALGTRDRNQKKKEKSLKQQLKFKIF